MATVKEKASKSSSKEPKKLFDLHKMLADLEGTHVRIVEGKKGPALDIRQYVNTDSYEGYTKKGVMLSLEKGKQLAEILGKEFLSQKK